MRKCERCGDDFVPYVGRQRFCCRACSDAWFQSERKEAVERYRQQQADEPRTYFEIAQGESKTSDAASVTGASSRPYGHDLPAPAYGSDPTGPEPSLGVDVNALPDMATCWWIPGAESPRATKAEADNDPE